MNIDVTALSLKKEISIRQLLTLFAGTMVGSGWMIGVTQWLSTAGMAWSISAFLIGTICMCLIALCTMELALAFPQSGGEVVYVFEGLGTFAAFVVGWTLAFLLTVWSAFQAIVSAWLICEIIPALQGPTLYTVADHPLSLGHLVIGSVGAIWLARVNYLGGKSSMQVQDILTYLVLIFVAAIFLLACSSGSSSNITTSSMAIPGGITGFLMVLVSVPVWFSAFTLVLQALGELKDIEQPKKVAKLVVLPVAGLGVFYILAIVTTAYGAPLETLKSTGFAPLAILGGNRWGEYFVLGVALIGILSSWNASYFGASRILFALGRARMIPEKFGIPNARHGSPSTAVIFICIATLMGMFAGRTYIATLLSALAIAQSLVYVLVCISLFRLRKYQPSLHRPVSVPGYPYVPFVALVVAILAVLSSVYLPLSAVDHAELPAEWLLLIIWIAIGGLFWRLERKRRNSITAEMRANLVHAR